MLCTILINGSVKIIFHLLSVSSPMQMLESHLVSYVGGRLIISKLADFNSDLIFFLLDWEFITKQNYQLLLVGLYAQFSKTKRKTVFIPFRIHILHVGSLCLSHLWIFKIYPHAWQICTASFSF